MTTYLQQRALLYEPLRRAPSPNLGIVVVIPAYREHHLLLSLMALERCELPACDTEVLVVVNDSEADTPELRASNIAIAAEAERWAAQHSNTRRWFHILRHYGLPRKAAGVGLARKIGMDEACRRLEQAGNPQGVIACFDADSCCASNYLREMERHFQAHPQCPACSIYFEHPLQGAEFPPEVYRAAGDYELHLRYFIQAQRYAGFPFAFHTVGSSMAVRCRDYQLQGGMNRRQAGEDFYFLHKFTSSPHFTELNSTCVVPSPRPSDRVPFGTGRAIGEALRKKTPIRTYAFQTFEDLRALFQNVPLLHTQDPGALALPETVCAFWKEGDAASALAEIRAHTSSAHSFRMRFFRWFNAFTVMKFAHFVRDNYFPGIPVEEAARALLIARGMDVRSIPGKDTTALLVRFRHLDRDGTGSYTQHIYPA